MVCSNGMLPNRKTLFWIVKSKEHIFTPSNPKSKNEQQQKLVILYSIFMASINTFLQCLFFLRKKNFLKVFSIHSSQTTKSIFRTKRSCDELFIWVIVHFCDFHSFFFKTIIIIMIRIKLYQRSQFLLRCIPNSKKSFEVSSLNYRNSTMYGSPALSRTLKNYRYLSRKV